MLQVASDSLSLPGVGVGEVKIHTLQFADDLLIFFDGTSWSAGAIKQILDAFSMISGLKINFDKSSIVPINLVSSQASALANFFGCSLHGFPFNYLGLPLSPKALRKSDYLPLAEKVDNRLAGWKALSLSRGGRLVLLNSVLSSIPAYFCSIFKLSVWVTKSIDKIRRDFFWKAKKLFNGFHCLVKWDHVCRPKKLGGIGIQNLRSKNSALLMKGLWSFYNARSLPWVRLLVQKHCRFRSPTSATVSPAGCCPVWKGVLCTSSPFHLSVSFSLGNGATTAFWNSRWSGELLLRNSLPNLYAVSNLKHLSVKSWARRFASTENLGFSRNLSWVEQQEVGTLRNLIDGVTLNEDLDSISWRWCTNGKFTVSGAYKFISFDGVDGRKISHLWSVKIPLKIKLFLWLAGRYRLLMADLLAKRGWHGPSICALCSAEAENLDHLFFRCSFAISLWDRILQNFPTVRKRLRSDTGGLACRWRRARLALSNSLQGRFDIWFAAACWELWNERNRRVFDNAIKSSEVCGRQVDSTAMIWILAVGDRVERWN